MTDLCTECGEYMNPHCKCERNTINELLDKIDDLKKSLKWQHDQTHKELQHNNGLREVIMLYHKAFDNIEEYADECGTCDNCDLDGLKTIISELHKELVQ